MIATVYPSKLCGSVRVPASKSMAHRMLIAAALADKPTKIEISALNKDIDATMACLTALGAEIYPDGSIWNIKPIASVSENPVLDCGESGSTLRFLLPVAAALGAEAQFIGRGRLPERPNIALTDAMKLHGADVDSDLLPMHISKGMTGGIWTLPGNISSQYITGLLFALPLLSEDSEIRLTTKLESASYVEMTLQAIRQFGIHVEIAESGWRIPGNQKYISPGELSVEGDWSAAAFWMAANAMGASIQLEGLNPETTQGDRAVEFLVGQKKINAENTPDLVPALAVAAAVLPQKTVVTGAARLRIKESDRLAAIADMLAAIGGKTEITEDGLIIESVPSFTGGRVNGVNDHRIVMAAAIAATKSSGPVVITDAQAIEKSYPGFFRDFKALGGIVDVQ